VEVAGVCTVFLQHTSASLILCENADSDVADLKQSSRASHPMTTRLRHDTEGPDDMASHVRSVLTRTTSRSILDSRLLLGTWPGSWEHRPPSALT
jgi:secondary thiamine-phosphate synthase enzyme